MDPEKNLVEQEFEADERLCIGLIDTYNDYQLEENEDDSEAPLPYIVTIKKNPKYSAPVAEYKEEPEETPVKPNLTKSQKKKLNKKKNKKAVPSESQKPQRSGNIEPVPVKEETAEEPEPSVKELTKSQKARLKKKAMKNKNKIVIPDDKLKTEPTVKKQELTEKVELKEEPAEPVTNDMAKSDSSEPVAKKVRKESFRRVKEEEVDPELLAKMGSNAFKNKKGARGSFGAKADEDLLKTRGKSFVKEKNKKKRGAYRGGKIDTESYSIKYESDD